MINKIISIIDCFISSPIVEERLSNAIDKLKINGHTILLVSNTAAPQHIINKVDYLYFDNRNQLFEDEYCDVSDVTFWKANDDIVINNVVTGIQRHGLSVLINLFNSLHFAKTLGFTHFQRFEVDDLFGDKSMDFINTVPAICFEKNKKGLFYFNETPQINDISFHYFYSNIDYFIDNVKRVDSEKDYVDFLMSLYGKKSFISAECYIYQNLISGNLNNIIVKNGQTDMTIDFPDTIWNTITSESNIDKKYDGCSSRLYLVYNENEELQNLLALLTYNYTSKNQHRLIKVYYPNSVETFNHQNNGKESFSYNIIPSGVEKIEVFNDDGLMYTETSDVIKNNIHFRKKN